MANSSNLRREIHQFRYHRAKGYDLDGDKVDTDEFIYDSGVSVEERDKIPRGQQGVERVDPVRAAPRASALNEAISLSDNGFSTPLKFAPGASGEFLLGWPKERRSTVTRSSYFLDGSPIAPSKYEAMFEAPKMKDRQWLYYCGHILL